MDLIWWAFKQNPQLIHQFWTVPFALLFYVLTRLGCLTSVYRYIYLALGGCILAVVSMGPYCWLVFVPAVVSSLLVFSVKPLNVHPWIFSAQMGWQTFWHILIQYNEYWLQESTDTRFLLAVSTLMLLTQRVTSVSMDLQEGKLKPLIRGTKVLPYLSYTLYFPALLGGPLCSFERFMSLVEWSGASPPPAPLRPVVLKASLALSLEWCRGLLTDLLSAHSSGYSQFSVLGGFLWVWAFSLSLRLRYYTHWALSECLSSAAGLWDGSSDGRPWTLEASSRLSAFARRWNGTTAAWLRRLVFQRVRVVPLALTFGFSALWHGLHPGQVVGFLSWAATVEADYRVHRRLRPLVGSPGRRLVYVCLSWAQTQLVLACVVIAVELRNFSSLKLFRTTYIGVFPLFYIALLFVL